MRKLIFIILSCLLISQISLSAQNKIQRSPTPGFGFTSKLYKYDESSLEYQMEMAFLIRDREERY
ncbi:MAG: hypothetical protein IK024_03245, partial [Treponema sp.]|nr:hypothetical protein [Treponema sp.]